MDRTTNILAYLVKCEIIRVGWVTPFWLLMDTNFVWLEALTMLVNNPINIFNH